MLNKKDLVGRGDIDAKIETTREALAFLRLRARDRDVGGDARRGDGHRDRGGAHASAEASKRITTGELNKLFADIIANQPPPAGPGRPARPPVLRDPGGVRPPTFFVSTNHPTDIDHAYRRFLINQLRKAYGFEGTPLRLVFRAHAQKKRGGRPPCRVQEGHEPRSR